MSFFITVLVYSTAPTSYPLTVPLHLRSTLTCSQGAWSIHRKKGSKTENLNQLQRKYAPKMSSMTLFNFVLLAFF